MDPLSDVLSLLKLRSYMSGGFEAGGAWAIRFGEHEGMKCYAAVSGECWLTVDGIDEPVRVMTGDCFLLPLGRSFVVASDLDLVPIDISTVPTGMKSGGITSINGGGEFFSVGGHFSLTGDGADMLLGVLPPIVHIRSESDRAMLRWCLERMREELRSPKPGSFLVAQQLATTLLVQALRLHMADASTDRIGWLFALADRQMSAAISAMHEQPAYRWTLQAMADRAGMSRTSFTLKFKAKVGTSPMDYLTRWRMMVGGERLTQSGDSVATIAESLGYESESAFSTAFKRIMGYSPRQYGRGRTSASTTLLTTV